MAIPIPVSGGVVKFQDGVSLQVFTTDVAATISTFEPRLSNPCGTGDTLIVTLSKQSGGGAGDDIVATFVDLELQPGTTVGGPVVMTAGQTLFVVLDADLADDATDLSGYVDGDFGGAVVTAAFTTLQRVLNRGRFTGVDTARDAEIVVLIGEKSDQMQNRLWDRIEREVGRVDFYDNGHPAHHIVTERIIADAAVVEVRLSPFATEDIVPAAEVRVDAPNRLLSLVNTDGARLRWGTGEIQITYDAGFVAVPPALVGAATDEVLFRIVGTGHGGSIRIGVTSRTDAEGSSQTYESGGLLESTMAAIDAHNKRSVR